MANSSNPPDTSARMQDDVYLYASNTNVSNFVSVKLSGDRNYDIWKKQMDCLMKTHDLCSLLDDRPVIDQETMNKIDKYDSLLQGWILGSLSEEVLGIVVNCVSAKDTWNQLKGYFDSAKQDSVLITREDTKTKTKDKNVISANTTANEKGGNPSESEAKGKEATRIETKDSYPITIVDSETHSRDKNVFSAITTANDKGGNQAESEAKGKEATQIETKGTKIKSLFEEAIKNGNWSKVLNELLLNKEARKAPINSDGNTVLHIVVGLHANVFFKRVLRSIADDLSDIKNSEGSTLLHIAAIVGNTYAAQLLIKHEKKLLNTPDNKKKTPLDKAYENMHLQTIDLLMEEAADYVEEKGTAEVSDKRSKKENSILPHFEIGVKLLVNAISAKQYDFASKLMGKNPEYATSDNSVLMAIARTFPSGLDYEEIRVYPNLGNIHDTIVNRKIRLFDELEDISYFLKDEMSSILRCQDSFQCANLFFLRVPKKMASLINLLISFLLLMVSYPFFMLYHLLWKVSATIVPPIRNLEKKKKEYDYAKRILDLVCMKIKEKDLADYDDSFYEGPFLEAACQNASEVVNGILKIWPEAIRCTDKNGHDIIQLATIHRSEKIYNLIYSWGDRKSIYRTMKDSSNNNMLHLAGRLAPSNKLKLVTGATLQLQRELQWREEVKNIVYPASITEVNIFNDTPEMVFTKEHHDLVKEGEAWIKTVAESCSITATLIITIVFAAAITVPGGTRSETGVPMFLEEAAFTVFAISDPISLFSSTTALLLFLSILTARFAEEDFLLLLPRRLIIGLCALLISTAAMMVAFGATLFIVFCHDKMWMLVPICGLALLPIVVFCILQVPLMIDLFQSTYISMFGKDNHKKSNLDPNDMRFFFGK